MTIAAGWYASLILPPVIWIQRSSDDMVGACFALRWLLWFISIYLDIHLGMLCVFSLALALKR
jgi:hypothetical protein